jgi:CRISPR-associated endoribonuclease Cas6
MSGALFLEDSMEATLLRELQKISFASFPFHLRATTELHLPPYKGSTLRGAFGTVFKDTVCVVDHRECDRCILKLKCAYPYIFDTPIPEGSERMRKYERAPHPFVIDPPLETKTYYKPGDDLSFGLTLIGKAIDYLPYFIYTFERLGADRGIGKGRRFGGGRFEIENVGWVAADGTENPVYDGQKKVLSNSFSPLTVSDLASPADPNLSQISVSFLTPTRITFDHQLHTYPEFHVVIRNLLRRLSNLAYFHCGQELKLDFKAIIESSKQVETSDGQVQWRDWERYSARQDTKMKMGGFVGEADYAGRLREFVPLLKMGEKLNVGKGTGFGLGRYRIA